MERFAELNMYRIRAYDYFYYSTGAFTWVPERDGSFLRITPSIGGPFTLTLSITLPSSPGNPFGMRLWVEHYQAGSGGSLITWPASFKFQTAGDAIPSAPSGSTTIWTGIYSADTSNIFMTKLGEWS